MLGVENRDTGAELWRHVLAADGDITGAAWEEVPAATNGFGNDNNFFIAELTQFQAPNVLYASTLNGFDGMELWTVQKCDEKEPEVAPVFTGGWPNGPVPCPIPPINVPMLGTLDLCVTNSGALTLKTAMTNFGPALFLGTVNYVLGASLFVSFDGSNFIPIFIFGNGDIRQSYVWSMEEYKGRLYIGTFQRPNLLNLFGIDFSGIDQFSADQVSAGATTLQNITSTARNTMFLPNAPPLPGITGGVGIGTADIGTADIGAANSGLLDDVVESGEFSLLSLDLNDFGLMSIPTLVTETSDAFGSCYPYGIRTMTTYEDKLIIGTAGASSAGGTLILEATHIDDSSKSGKGKGKGKSA